MTLQVALARAEITLPECQKDDLRYALVDDGFNYYFNIYLKLESWSVDCMNGFLAANNLVDTFQVTRVGGSDAETPLGPYDLWIEDDPVRRMGWQLGPDQRFQEFAGTTKALYRVTALVQHIPESTDVQAYVYAFRVG